MINAPVTNGFPYPLLGSSAALAKKGTLFVAASLFVPHRTVKRPLEGRGLVSKEEGAIIRRLKGEQVVVLAEMQMRLELRRYLHAPEKEGIGASAGTYVILETLVGVHEMPQKLEKAYKIGLARTIGAYEDVESPPQGKVLKLTNRFVPRKRDLLQYSACSCSHSQVKALEDAWQNWRRSEVPEVESINLGKPVSHCS